MLLLRTILRRTIAIVFGVAVALVAIEIGTRIVTAYDRNFLDQLLNPEPYPPDRRLTLIHLIRPNADDRIVYELRPGVRGIFIGVDVAINAHGMRDVERPRAKPPGVFRIVGIGDSHAFGWGVRREESFLARLEELLNHGLARPGFEVWNAAVPGYNTVQQVRALELANLDPDLVLVCHVGNDADLPNFISQKPDLWSPRRSFAWYLLRRRWLLWQGDRIRPFDLVGVVPDRVQRRFVLDERRIPRRFWPLYGADRWREAHRRLDELARERGFAVAALLPGNDPPDSAMVAALRRLYDELGRPVIDPSVRVQRHLEETGATMASLAVSPRDAHLNATGHRLIAEELAAALPRAGLVPGS